MGMSFTKNGKTFHWNITETRERNSRTAAYCVQTVVEGNPYPTTTYDLSYHEVRGEIASVVRAVQPGDDVPDNFSPW